MITPSFLRKAMLHRACLCFLLTIAFHFSAFAQEKKKDVTPADTTKIKLLEKKPDVTAPETPKEIKLEKKLQKKLYSIPQFINETFLFIKQPTKWKGNDWLRLGIVTVASIGVMPLDEQITNSTQGEQRYYNNAFIEGGRIYGEWYS
ncbi:MAG: hypothetical protein JJE25_09355, partial [Bacteroidia bacterium]|nr:hypothetical protein [Bacteroidia bacterium]